MSDTAPLPLRGWTSPWHVVVAIILTLTLAIPARAQDKEKVYDLAELSTPPRLASSAQATRLINSSYPAQLKTNGIGGTAQLEFVVDKAGKVEPGSVDVAATVPALADAAKSIAEKLEFTPGKVKDQVVRTRVVLPLLYKP